MKKLIKLLPLLLGVITSNSQNPKAQFYNMHPETNNIKWYFQLNEDPVIIQNGVIIGENGVPDWFNGFQFIKCPGVFNSVTTAYSYLSDNSLFVENKGNNYMNKSDTNQMQYYLQSGQDILQRSRDYATNDEAILDINSIVLKNCRQQAVFAEMYIEVNDYEFVLLISSSMYWNPEGAATLNINTQLDRQKIIDIIVNSDAEEAKKYDITQTILVKENGIWKALTFSKVLEFNAIYLDVYDFKDYTSTIHVTSSVNSSGYRTYIEN